jgi:hypothetical protein
MAEIATTFTTDGHKCTEATVRSRLFRARNRAKQKYGRGEKGDHNGR